MVTKLVKIKVGNGYISAWAKVSKNKLTLEIWDNQNPCSTFERLIEKLGGAEY